MAASIPEYSIPLLSADDCRLLVAQAAVTLICALVLWALARTGGWRTLFTAGLQPKAWPKGGE